MPLFRNDCFHNIKIKICGFSREEDIDECNKLGIDALGFLLGNAGGIYPNDKLTEQQAKLLVSKVAPHHASVLLIKTSDKNEIQRILDFVNPNAVQLQNPDLKLETLILLKSIYPKIEWIKTIKIKENETVSNVIDSYGKFFDYADAILLDSAKGGSGEVHNWTVSKGIAEVLKMNSIPVVLAGGLNEYNVVEAINVVKPDMVDIMTGASKDRGIKDINKIKNLVKIIKG